MKKNYSKFMHFCIFAVLLVSIILTSNCLAPMTEDEIPVIHYSFNYTYTGSNDEIYHVANGAATTIDCSIDLGGFTRDLYYIFTNPSTSTSYSNPTASNIVEANLLNKINSPDASDKNLSNAVGMPVIYDKPEIQKFNENSLALNKNIIKNKNEIVLMPKPEFDIVDATADFWNDVGVKVAAKCRKVVSDGTKTLNIWVANDCWVSGGSKAFNVDQAMVDAMANKFLIAGAGNDVYDWVTNIFGAEWGSHSYPSQLISANNEITILLYDIDNDNSTTGGVVGFFYSRDNFKTSTYSTSNQRIMFYLDAVMYAIPEGVSWEWYDKWPSIVISTLAHEFQHMIHYYQKAVLLTGGYTAQVWINEMCSMAAEDLIADKLLVNGPRGVLYSDPGPGSAGNQTGRLPLFNYYNDDSVNDWLGSVRSYSINYALGAYLSRNFGGAALFKNIVQSTYTNEQAIINALSILGYTETFSSIMQKWGGANLVSDNSTPPAGYYKYNNGSSWVTSTVGSITYNLGSINLYNYYHAGYSQTGPYIYTSSPIGDQAGYSNLLFASNRYFKAGTGLTGKVKKTVNIQNSNVKLTIVIK